MAKRPPDEIEAQRDRSAALAVLAAVAARELAGGIVPWGVLVGGHPDGLDQETAQHRFRQEGFRHAAERGYPDAELMPTRYPTHGLAGASDPAQARHYFLKAAQSAGVSQARFDFRQLPASEAKSIPSTTAASGRQR